MLCVRCASDVRAMRAVQAVLHRVRVCWRMCTHGELRRENGLQVEVAAEDDTVQFMMESLKPLLDIPVKRLRGM